MPIKRKKRNLIEEVDFSIPARIFLCPKGDIYHRTLFGFLHRINGPAVIRKNGTKEWKVQQ